MADSKKCAHPACGCQPAEGSKYCGAYCEGAAERPSVVAAYGGGGSGFQSAPGIGRTVAEWIVHGEPRTIPGVRALLPGRPSPT